MFGLGGTVSDVVVKPVPLGPGPAGPTDDQVAERYGFGSAVPCGVVTTAPVLSSPVSLPSSTTVTGPETTWIGSEHVPIGIVTSCALSAPV